MEDEIFLQRHRIKEQRPDSFAEIQAQFARETAQYLNSLGEDLFQVLQGNTRHYTYCGCMPMHLHLANVILTWFYWSHSRSAPFPLPSPALCLLLLPQIFQMG